MESGTKVAYWLSGKTYSKKGVEKDDPRTTSSVQTDHAASETDGADHAASETDDAGHTASETVRIIFRGNRLVISLC